MPLAVKFAADVLTAGVAPVVPGDPSGDLAAAVAGHAHNWNMTTMLSGRDFIDEVCPRMVDCRWICITLNIRLHSGPLRDFFSGVHGRGIQQSRFICA